MTPNHHAQTYDSSQRKWNELRARSGEGNGTAVKRDHTYRFERGADDLSNAERSQLADVATVPAGLTDRGSRLRLQWFSKPPVRGSLAPCQGELELMVAPRLRRACVASPISAERERRSEAPSTVDGRAAFGARPRAPLVTSFYFSHPTASAPKVRLCFRRDREPMRIFRFRGLRGPSRFRRRFASAAPTALTCCRFGS